MFSSDGAANIITEAVSQFFLLKRMVRTYYTSVNGNWFII